MEIVTYYNAGCNCLSNLIKNNNIALKVAKQDDWRNYSPNCLNYKTMSQGLSNTVHSNNNSVFTCAHSGASIKDNNVKT